MFLFGKFFPKVSVATERIGIHKQTTCLHYLIVAKYNQVNGSGVDEGNRLLFNNVSTTLGQSQGNLDKEVAAERLKQLNC